MKEESNISWIKWEDVCKPKKFGGFGVRNLWLVNLALRGKWRWRLLSRASGIWRDIITSIYDVTPTSSIMYGIVGCL